MMQVVVRSAWLPKAGNTIDEYEDAFYPNYQGERGGSRISFAVADGASEGMLSGPWAQILVRAFCRVNSPPAPFDALLNRALKAWTEWRTYYLQAREQQNRPIQWYEETGLQRGAFSTLLGITLTQDAANRWDVIALGDSCLFQVREGKLITTFPLKKSTEFDNRPFLIASNPANNAGLLERVRHTHSDWRSGDRFYLMTDALAYWFLHECEAGHSPWDDLPLQRQEFERHVQALRAARAMRNDDVTLISIEIR